MYNSAQYIQRLRDYSGDNVLPTGDVYQAMVWAASNTGLPLLPAHKLPPVFLLEQGTVNHLVSNVGGKSGMTYGAAEANGDFIMLALPWSSDSVVQMSTLIHEMVHCLQANAGRKMGIHYPLGHYDGIEYEAYKAQADYMWEHGRTDPRLHPAMQWENIIAQTGSKELAELSWLEGYNTEADHEARLNAAKGKTTRTDLDQLFSQFRNEPWWNADLTPQGDAWDGGFAANHNNAIDLDDLDALILVQGGSADASEYIEAFQHLIDNSLVSRLGPWYEQEARQLIRRGDCEAKRY